MNGNEERPPTIDEYLQKINDVSLFEAIKQVESLKVDEWQLGDDFYQRLILPKHLKRVFEEAMKSGLEALALLFLEGLNKLFSYLSSVGKSNGKFEVSRYFYSAILVQLDAKCNSDNVRDAIKNLFREMGSFDLKYIRFLIYHVDVGTYDLIYKTDRDFIIKMGIHCARNLQNYTAKALYKLANSNDAPKNTDFPVLSSADVKQSRQNINRVNELMRKKFDKIDICGLSNETIAYFVKQCSIQIGDSLICEEFNLSDNENKHENEVDISKIERALEKAFTFMEISDKIFTYVKYLDSHDVARADNDVATDGANCKEVQPIREARSLPTSTCTADERPAQLFELERDPIEPLRFIDDVNSNNVLFSDEQTHASSPSRVATAVADNAMVPPATGNGVITKLIENYGFVESIASHEDIYFSFRDVIGDASKLEVGDELQFKFMKTDRIHAKAVTKLPKGSIEEVKHSTLVGKVIRPLSRYPSKQPGLIQDITKGGLEGETYSYGITSMAEKRDCHSGDVVNFNLAKSRVTHTERVVNIKRKYYFSTVKSKHDSYGFLCLGPVLGKELYFSMRSILGDLDISEHDPMKYAAVWDPGKMKYSAVDVTKDEQQFQRSIQRIKKENMDRSLFPSSNGKFAPSKFKCTYVRPKKT